MVCTLDMVRFTLLGEEPIEPEWNKTQYDRISHLIEQKEVDKESGNYEQGHLLQLHLIQSLQK